MRKAIVVLLSTMILVAIPLYTNAEEICFPVPEAQRLLMEVEAGRQCLTESLPAADGVIAVQAERIAEVTGERDKAVSDLKDGGKRCEEAVKEARGTWFQRAKSAGGWMGIGGVIAAIAILLL